MSNFAECFAGYAKLHNIHTLTFLDLNCTRKAWQDILQYDVCAQTTYIVSSNLHHRWLYREINLPHFDCRAVLQFRIEVQKEWPYHCDTINSYPKSLPDLANLFRLKELIIGIFIIWNVILLIRKNGFLQRSYDGTGTFYLKASCYSSYQNNYDARLHRQWTTVMKNVQ